MSDVHRYTRELRDTIRRQLGNKCVQCAASEHLQFDCIVPRGRKHHELNYRQRMNFYKLEAIAGNLQLLCPKCHVTKTLLDIARQHFLSINFQCPKCSHAHTVSEMMNAVKHTAAFNLREQP